MCTTIRTNSIEFRFGPRIDLSSFAANLSHAPDQNVAIRESQGTSMAFLTTGRHTELLRGDRLSELTRDPQSVFYPPNSSTQFPFHYAGVGAVIDTTAGCFAFFHSEHQGHGLPDASHNVSGFMASIGLAQYANGELKLVGQQPIFESSHPIQKCPDAVVDIKQRRFWGSQGVGDPSVIQVTDKEGIEWIYLYFTDYSRRFCRRTNPKLLTGGPHDTAGTQIALARCRADEFPDHSKWSRSVYGGEQNGHPIIDFTTQLKEGIEQPVIDGRHRFFFPRDCDCVHPCVTTTLDDELAMVFGAMEDPGEDNPPNAFAPDNVSGIYLSTSADGAHWTKPERIWRILPVPFHNWTVGLHPTLWFEPTPGRYRREGWLWYGYSKRFCVTNQPHELHGHRVRLSRLAIF